MDGTLLNSKHEVSDLFYELFDQLKSRGIRFVAASGRQYHSMEQKLAKIKDDITFISENGAIIKEKGIEISSTLLDHDLVQELLGIVNTIPDSSAMLCGKDKAFFDGSSAGFFEELKEYYSAFEIVEDYTHIKEEIVKIAVYHNQNAEQFIYPKVQHLQDKVKVKLSGQHWVDLNHVDAHKGKALQQVMAIHGIKPEEVMVFGDYNNDLEMLSLTPNSFAMANAHPNAKKAAKHQTTSHDDFGVERILQQLLA